jgi:hypothetical protein
VERPALAPPALAAPACLALVALHPSRPHARAVPRAYRPLEREVSAVETPRRLTLSQIVEMLLTRHAGERSSVSLTRTATGDTAIDVKVRTGDDGETQTVEDAEHKAREVFDRLASVYPPRTATPAGEVTLTRNAKGETQVSVELKTSDEAPSVGEVGATAQREYDRLRMKYPMANGLTAKPGSVA